MSSFLFSSYFYRGDTYCSYLCGTHRQAHVSLKNDYCNVPSRICMLRVNEGYCENLPWQAVTGLYPGGCMLNGMTLQSMHEPEGATSVSLSEFDGVRSMYGGAKLTPEISIREKSPRLPRLQGNEKRCRYLNGLTSLDS